MNILDKFLPRYSKSKVVELFNETYKAILANNAGWLSAEAEHERFNQPDYSVYESQSNLYRTLSWVQMAISFTANAAASVNYSVKQLAGEDEKDIPNHPFELLLGKPNPLNSRSEFLSAVFSYRLINGNAYIWLNKPNESAPPVEMWNIPSHMIKPIPDGRMFLKGYLFDTGDGKTFPLEPWEVVHIKNFHPLSPFLGLSPIEAIATVATGDLSMQKWNTQLFGKNNARLPGMMLFSDPIIPAEWNKLKSEVDYASMHRQIMMLQNVGKGGVQWVQAAASQKDMEFLGGRSFTKEEIFNIYAPGLASMLAVSATEANALAGRATFADYTLWPLLSSAAEKFTLNVLPAYGDNLRGEFDDVRFTDRKMKLEEELAYSKVHTIDEIRIAKYGDKEIGDDRGKLLPAQIAAEPFGLGEPPEEQPKQLQQANIMPQEEAEPGEAEEEQIETNSSEGEQEEMKKWEKFAIAGLTKPRKREFVCKHIPDIAQKRIRASLADCTTAEQIKSVFAEPATTEYDALLLALSENVKLLREVV